MEGVAEAFFGGDGEEDTTGGFFPGDAVCGDVFEEFGFINEEPVHAFAEAGEGVDGFLLEDGDGGEGE